MNPAPSTIEAVGEAGMARYSPDRPLILITDYPPDAPGGGAVILRSLLEPEDRRRVLWLSPSPSADAPATLRAGSSGRGRRSPGLDQTIYARALADEALAIARRRGARAFWVVMHGAGVAIAARLARPDALPIHLTVHDDPAYANAIRSRRYLPLVPLIARDFGRAIRRAGSVDVIGPRMADHYRRKYGIDPSIVHRALPGPVEPAPGYDKARHGLRIGVLGSTYSYGQLPILARAVGSAARRLGVPGRVLIVGRSYGERLKAEVDRRVEVEVIGHVEEPEAVPRLRDCFALYLNYPFGPLDAALRRLSFPTKLGTYALAARPILVHAPPDSSVMPLTESESYARHWGSPDEAEGASALMGMWDDPRFSESRHVEAEAVRLRYYDPSTNRRALFETLGALVPPFVGASDR
jgi:hypothetical protein